MVCCSSSLFLNIHSALNKHIFPLSTTPLLQMPVLPNVRCGLLFASPPNSTKILSLGPPWRAACMLHLCMSRPCQLRLLQREGCIKSGVHCCPRLLPFSALLSLPSPALLSPTSLSSSLSPPFPSPSHFPPLSPFLLPSFPFFSVFSWPLLFPPC